MDGDIGLGLSIGLPSVLILLSWRQAYGNSKEIKHLNNRITELVQRFSERIKAMEETDTRLDEKIDDCATGLREALRLQFEHCTVAFNKLHERMNNFINKGK